MKTRRKNTSEAQQMLFCYCMFCTNGAGVLKSTHLWFAWFACLRFSPGFVGRDLPGIRETAWPQIGWVRGGNCALFLETMHIIFLKTHTHTQKKGSGVIGRHWKHSVPKQQECYWEGRGMTALESQALAKRAFVLSAQSSDVPVPNQDEDLSLPALPESIEGALFPCTVFLGCHLSESWENSSGTCFLPHHRSPASLSSLLQR